MNKGGQINNCKHFKRTLEGMCRPGICTVGIDTCPYDLLPEHQHWDVLLVGGRCLVTDLGTALPIAAGAPKGFAAHRPCAADARGGVHAFWVPYVPLRERARRLVLRAADLARGETRPRMAGLRAAADQVWIEFTAVTAAGLPSSRVVGRRATALHLRTGQTPTPRACVCLITDAIRPTALLFVAIKFSRPTALCLPVVPFDAAAAVAGVFGHIADTLARAALCPVVVLRRDAALCEGVRGHAAASNAEVAVVRRLAAFSTALLAFTVAAVMLYHRPRACTAGWLI